MTDETTTPPEPAGDRFGVSLTITYPTGATLDVYGAALDPALFAEVLDLVDYVALRAGRIHKETQPS